MKLLAELKRRNVIRMGGLYLVGAWLILQVAETLLPIFHTPDWVLQALVVLLALGFLPAVVFSWLFELTPEGIKRDAEVTPDQSNASKTGRRMDRLIFAGVIALIVVVAADRYWPRAARVEAESASIAAAVPPSTPTDASAKASTTYISVDPKSIAVLAFANMSPDKENEYFSDGVAEEILNALAKVDDLKVAGRTSSFYFKGRNERLAAIGSALGVAHVLEGSVRKQGNRLRINAKLLRVRDGVEMWSETFDGLDTDIFALQESIARSVTGELKVALNAGQQDRLVNVGTGNADAYTLYLQASATLDRRDSARYPEALAQLERATTLDPGFARAYSRMAALYGVGFNAGSFEFNVALAAAEKFAHRASQLDPSLAEPHAVLGLTYRYQRKYREADDAFARALALDPDDVTTNFWHALSLVQAGFRHQGIAALDRTLQIDPLLPNALFWRGREHVADGELGQGEKLLRRAAEGGHSFVGITQWKLDQARGDREAGISKLTTGLNYFSTDFPAGATDVFARAMFGDAEAKTRALALIDSQFAANPLVPSGVSAYVMIHAGEPARAFAVLQERPTNNDGLVMGELFSPSLADARRAPEFPEFLRRIGLAKYWDDFGAPDQCHKAVNGDYLCN